MEFRFLRWTTSPCNSVATVASLKLEFRICICINFFALLLKTPPWQQKQLFDGHLEGVPVPCLILNFVIHSTLLTTVLEYGYCVLQDGHFRLCLLFAYFCLLLPQCTAWAYLGQYGHVSCHSGGLFCALGKCVRALRTL